MHVFWWVNSKYKRYTSSDQRLGSAGEHVRLNKEHWKSIFIYFPRFRILGDFPPFHHSFVLLFPDLDFIIIIIIIIITRKCPTLLTERLYNYLLNIF